ncbi:hypothetical protein N0824_00407 [Microcystis sp. 0824]|uniref:Uncharacterized protein n=1 Tax=Microcystis aeruginosa NIES-2549 TaxID=1641812 RepID=A0A0F6U274_MICAE|nr:hypothetical protein MYAER_1164 [Microcystis aeruginosa NIES-2549]AOC51918.1 hypothetical protein amyaer_1181 [Microcystis aeruginosa NIES-2481]GBF52560.1 hypothetical protein N0824_00407 [Microcystis sp. 0824]
MIKLELTPNFSGEFPFKNPNLVDLQKLDAPCPMPNPVILHPDKKRCNLPL